MNAAAFKRVNTMTTEGVKSQITAEARPSVEWNGLLSMDLRQGTLNEHSQELYNVERGILFFI